MIRRTALTLLAIGVAVSLAAEAKSKERKRAAKPVATEQWGTPGFHQQPARMIEVKPGLWISSYGCVTDDGYGRFLPCDITDTGGR